jgi:hypothetical protein
LELKCLTLVCRIAKRFDGSRLRPGAFNFRQL